MGDWTQTVKDRENGEVVGFIGHNEPIDAQPSTKPDGEPLFDVRRVAIDDAKAADREVVDPVQPPATDAQVSSVPSGSGTVEQTGGDQGNASGSSDQ